MINVTEAMSNVPNVSAIIYYVGQTKAFQLASVSSSADISEVPAVNVGISENIDFTAPT